MLKRCPACGIEKPLSDFYRNRVTRLGVQSHCIPCHSTRVQDRRREQRLERIAYLGGKCVRCGFDDPRALQVDHVHGGGTQDLTKHSHVTMERLKAYPNDFQLLCANCNWIKREENHEYGGRRAVQHA